MLYDPQQRPTASQSLQHIFFQAINTFPAPALNAEQVASTFMKQPYKKSENEMKIEERAMAKKVSMPYCSVCCSTILPSVSYN